MKERVVNYPSHALHPCHSPPLQPPHEMVCLVRVRHFSDKDIWGDTVPRH